MVGNKSKTLASYFESLSI